jgi:hypothetical protein
MMWARAIEERDLGFESTAAVPLVFNDAHHNGFVLLEGPAAAIRISNESQIIDNKK